MDEIGFNTDWSDPASELRMKYVDLKNKVETYNGKIIVFEVNEEKTFTECLMIQLNPIYPDVLIRLAIFALLAIVLFFSSGITATIITIVAFLLYSIVISFRLYLRLGEIYANDPDCYYINGRMYCD